MLKKSLTKLETSNAGLALSAPKPKNPTRFDITNRCSGGRRPRFYMSALPRPPTAVISQPARGYAYLDGPFGPEGKTQNNSEGEFRVRSDRRSRVIHLGEEF